MKQEDITTPYYIVYEDRLRKNLELISYVREKANINIILAFKAFALWKAFPIIKEYFTASTASSLNEAYLSHDKLGNEIHSYTPAYTDYNIDEFLRLSSHLTFNSLSQYERYKNKVKEYNSNHKDSKVSCGLRINPELSIVETDLYNPCTPGSRLGISSTLIGSKLPEGVEGLHFHALCESTSYDLQKLLSCVEAKYKHLFSQIKWINMGGGHLMTRDGYDINHLIKTINDFHAKYPDIELIMEPGSAFAWRTGDLVSSVVDIVNNHNIKTAILDVSFACHMPDCLEMPYKPIIEGATDAVEGKPTYRMGGNSCLSGDYIGNWSFDKELQIGDRIVFEDMIHYTTVKTTMFNGVHHPAIAIQHVNGNVEILREFTYEDYKNRMS